MGITLRSDFEVFLVDSMGSDELICQAARVSTLGAESIGTSESDGLIKFLMRNRHGSPFEHSAMTFRISAPIFVWREFMRHRIGFSYNEESGRYKELDPVFYIPNAKRDLVQTGKAGEYKFEPGDAEQYKITYLSQVDSIESAWESYQKMLKSKVAREIARMCLPLSIYSTAYVTCNPRSIMSFLSLRTKYEDSVFPSYPQWEINQVANMMEDYFHKLFPITHNAFHNNGRVSP